MTLQGSFAANDVRPAPPKAFRGTLRKRRPCSSMGGRYPARIFTCSEGKMRRASLVCVASFPHRYKFIFCDAAAYVDVVALMICNRGD